MMKEHERIALRTDIPAAGLKAGDVGTVVHIYKDGKAYEVEFVTLEGKTAAVVTLEADQVRSVNPREIPHARDLAAARRYGSQAWSVDCRQGRQGVSGSCQRRAIPVSRRHVLRRQGSRVEQSRAARGPA